MSVIAAAEGQVGLLIDFENLVRAVDEEDIDCEAVFRLADEYGRVLVANAYADRRMKDVNQYQADLNGLGIDLVHVANASCDSGHSPHRPSHPPGTSAEARYDAGHNLLRQTAPLR